MSHLKQLNGPQLAPFTADIARLYRHCYTRPPWSETSEQCAAFADGLPGTFALPGFKATVSYGSTDDLLGICYGWPTPADLNANRIYHKLIRDLGRDLATAITRDAFEVAELFVHPDAQGRGLGRTLLRATTADWPKAWLLTSPQAPAAKLYLELGWTCAGRLTTEDGTGQLQLAVYASPSSVTRALSRPRRPPAPSAVRPSGPGGA